MLVLNVSQSEAAVFDDGEPADIIYHYNRRLKHIYMDVIRTTVFVYG